MTDDRPSAQSFPAARTPDPAAWEDADEGSLNLDLYPELTPVIALAVDAVIYTFGIDEEADAALVAHLERVTVAKTLPIYAPMAAIAAQAGRGALRSRDARAAAVARAAEAMAACVAEVAAVLQLRDEAHAQAVARDASDAAQLVAASLRDGDAPQAAATAAQVAAAVREAAAQAARERARAAALVAHAATSAAAGVAEAEDLVSVAVEVEAFTTASRVRAIALDTCYQAAIDVAATAAEQVLTNRTPV